MKNEEPIEELAELLKDNNMTRRALLVSHDFSLTGAPLALFEMAKQMENTGIKTVIASASDGPLKKYIEEEGFSVAVIPRLSEGNVLSEIADLFDMAVINTIVNGPLIEELNGSITPVIWWIHESEIAYIYHYDMLPLLLESNIYVFTVGERARRSLHKYRPWFAAKELLYCIEDMTSCNDYKGDGIAAAYGGITFAIIGTLEHRKGQDVLLEAVQRLSETELDRCRFILVGAVGEDNVTARVKAASEKEGSKIEYCSHIERKDMPDFYNIIDCLICASRDEPMPMTVTEACMTKRIVICSENTGTAPLLEKYDAGIVYHNDDPAELVECIRRVLTEHSLMGGMRNNARRLYEENFSPEFFCAKLEANISDITGKQSPNKGKQVELEEVAKAYIDNLRELRETEKELGDANRELEIKETEIDGLKSELAGCRDTLKEMENAFFWKLSKPARFMLDRVKKRNTTSL